MANQSYSSVPDEAGVPVQPVGFVRVGSVIGTHATGGRIRIHPETDNPERFVKDSVLLIGDASFTVAHVTSAPGGSNLIVALNEVTTRERAAALVNQLVLVATEDTPALPDDIYYHYQLIDMKVINLAGVELGTVTEVITTGANDVYVVTAEGSELMIPALAHVIVNVNVADALMTVQVPEGIEPRATISKLKRPPRRRLINRTKPT